ncbi:hypothetical protein J1N35_028200 [Gossypium stocksii]|uniref:Uncharacterized protein n=1 Tax=Gossypium stocksii TaxID=47602 RepID=A0A9D3UVQ6_9ROSI|nr:hypothetical protein J1N35_028200 [Gossypium stocksii]
MANYQLTLSREIDARLKAKCDKLADAFVDDIDPTESGGNCIAEEDHEVKSESDSVTISMNQQEREKPDEEKGGYVEEKSGGGNDCIAKQMLNSDDKVDDLVNGVFTDDDATHIEIKTGSDSIPETVNSIDSNERFDRVVFSVVLKLMSAECGLDSNKKNLQKLQDMADYQLTLSREIDARLKAKCDKLADAFVDDIDPTESGDNCIVEEDHEVKSGSDSVTISTNQQDREKPVEEKGRK